MKEKEEEMGVHREEETAAEGGQGVCSTAGERGGAAGTGRMVVVAVKMDAQSRELLTWALVKVAEPGDRVIALHVLLTAGGTNSPSSSPSLIIFSSARFGGIYPRAVFFLVLCRSFESRKELRLLLFPLLPRQVLRVRARRLRGFLQPEASMRAVSSASSGFASGNLRLE